LTPDLDPPESNSSVNSLISNAFFLLNRRFKFKKRSQLIIGARDEPLPVVAVGVCNPNCSRIAIHG
jgi:hypothetical protein